MSSTQSMLSIGDSRLDSKARPTIILIGVFLPISTLALLLRLYTRRVKGLKLHIDDYLAIASYVFWVGWVVVTLWGSENGGGWPLEALPQQYQRIQAIMIYILPMLTASSMVTAKFSILTLYLRVFSPSRSFLIQSWIVGALCLLHWAAAVLATVFQCLPVRAGWDIIERAKPTTKCANARLFYIGIEIPNGLLDFIVAGMAIFVVRELFLSTIHKIGLAVMFLLCTLVAVLGFARIAFVFNPENFAVWTQVEFFVVQNAFVVICCCLPTYGMYLSRVGSSLQSLAEYIRNRTNRSRTEYTRSSAKNDKPHNDSEHILVEMDPSIKTASIEKEPV